MSSQYHFHFHEVLQTIALFLLCRQEISSKAIRLRLQRLAAFESGTASLVLPGAFRSADICERPDTPYNLKRNPF